MRSKVSHSALLRRSPEVGKWVTVVVSGNPHLEHRILISPYTMREFGNLLSHLTEKLQPPFGAVWRLFTTKGTEIVSLDDIEGGKQYVAAGRAGLHRHARGWTPVGARSKDTRTRPDRRELRSQSAVATLGKSSALAGLGASGSELDTSSDTNMKHRRKQPQNSQRDRPWDQTVTLEQQQHYQANLQQVLHHSQQKMGPASTVSVENLSTDSDGGSEDHKSWAKTTTEGRRRIKPKLLI